MTSCLRFYRPLLFRTHFILFVRFNRSTFLIYEPFLILLCLRQRSKSGMLLECTNDIKIRRFLSALLSSRNFTVLAYYIDTIAGHRTPYRISGIFKLSYHRCNLFSCFVLPFACHSYSASNMLNLPPFLCSITNIAIIKLIL